MRSLLFNRYTASIAFFLVLLGFGDIFGKYLVSQSNTDFTGFACKHDGSSGTLVSWQGLSASSQKSDPGDLDWYVEFPGDLTDGENVFCRSGGVGGYYIPERDVTRIALGSSLIVGEFRYGVRVYQ